jgi:polar amino acid transport system substrate-binding protein
MKIVTQNFKTGEIKINDVPPPNVFTNAVLVKNYYSVISAGTARTTIDLGNMTMLQKARSKPDEVKKILKEVRQQGIWAIYKKVIDKLETPKTLGYSTAGIVIAVDDNVENIKVGDRVACAGARYAIHADIVAVPKNLVVKIPNNVHFNEAAYSTVGSIAMQGIRQTNPTLGEKIVVIGLGLLGQLTVQMLKANGCYVIGVDLDDYSLDNAVKISHADIALSRNKQDVKNIIKQITNGYGADGVIITAATSSNDPIELAGEISRERGRVVLVGAVGMAMPRDPYHMKELEFKLSRSYGPGRYDYNYEERGNDYPIGYVRWTENRNMESFLQLIEDKKINVEAITTHTFSIDEADKAYKLISGEKKENYVGILLKYPEIDESKGDDYLKKIYTSQPKHIDSNISIGFIGVGNHAQVNLVPHITKGNINKLVAVCDSQGNVAKHIAEKYGFEYCTSNLEDVFKDTSINSVLVSTRHNLHAECVIKCIENNKNIFVEKPLCLNEEELNKITELYNTKGITNENNILMVGFNRRFAPFTKKVKEFFKDVKDPLIFNYRVNAGFIPKAHWVHDPIEGGGRIVGEVCHFIDLLQFITDSDPISVYTQSISSNNSQITEHDNVNITIKMKNGSLGIITYIANGDKSVSKEKLEVTGGDYYAILDNYEKLELYKNGKRTEIKSKLNKGWKTEIEEYINGIKVKKNPISFDSQRLTTLTTFKILESLKTNEVITIE